MLLTYVSLMSFSFSIDSCVYVDFPHPLLPFFSPPKFPFRNLWTGLQGRITGFCGSSHGALERLSCDLKSSVCCLYEFSFFLGGPTRYVEHGEVMEAVPGSDPGTTGGAN